MAPIVSSRVRQGRFWGRMAVLLSLCAAFVFLAGPDALAAKKRKNVDSDQRYASLVMDAATGEVISAANPDSSLHPASLTKVMTLLLTFDALADGRLKLHQTIPISQHAAAASPSKLGLKPGQRIRVEDAIKAVAVKSANDIAIALAEALAGSEARFAQQMTARARGLGMMRTRFMNASGLPHPAQVSSARDMATLARHVIQNYPGYYRYYGLKSFSYGGRVHPNHNRLMSSYRGMDGMKTGYINASGYNLVASAVRGNRRLIGVVFGGRSAVGRNQHMAELLDRGFSVPRGGALPHVDLVSLPPPPSEAAEEAAETRVQRFAGIVPVRKPRGDREAEWNRSVSPSRSKPGSLGTFTYAEIAPAAGVAVPGVSVSSPVLGGADRAPGWAIQIGAYQSRDATDRALSDAVGQLPSGLAHASPVVAPLKTVDRGWLFRARLANLTRPQAQQACSYFRGCLMIPPQAY